MKISLPAPRRDAAFCGIAAASGQADALHNNLAIPDASSKSGLGSGEMPRHDNSLKSGINTELFCQPLLLGAGDLELRECIADDLSPCIGGRKIGAYAVTDFR